jgi:hypothetical protein
MRMIAGGALVLVSLPLLAPLILGTLITRAVRGVFVLTHGVKRIDPRTLPFSTLGK